MSTFVAFLLLPFVVSWSGYVLSIMWRWFVCPAFGVKEIALPVAIGLMLIVNMFLRNITKKDDDALVIAFTNMLTSAVTLGMGYIVTLFM